MNEKQFNSLYRDYGRRMYNYLIWMTGNPGLSDDILQSVFIKLWRMDCFPTQGDGFQPWLFTVARNTCLDFLRKHRRFSQFRMKYLHEHEHTHINRPAETHDNYLWEELENLPEQKREILFFHFKLGYSYREIGTMLNISESLVRVTAFRTLKQLRKTLVKKGYHES